MQPLRGSSLRSIPLPNLLLAGTLRIPARGKAGLIGHGSPSGFYHHSPKNALKWIFSRSSIASTNEIAVRIRSLGNVRPWAKVLTRSRLIGGGGLIGQVGRGGRAKSLVATLMRSP